MGNNFQKTQLQTLVLLCELCAFFFAISAVKPELLRKFKTL